MLLREFGNWCIFRAGWWNWDVSWLATYYLGSLQLNKPQVSAWAAPCWHAFLGGCWFLFWTDTHLYWCPKPAVSAERGRFGRRLHCEDGPACANEVENLYFWHGVLVPAYAVMRPGWITLDEIKSEENEEVRRVLIERFGWPRYLKESGAKVAHRRFNERDRQWEELYALDDGTRRLVISDPSTGRRYALGVPREIATCEQAQLWMQPLDALAVHRS